MTVQIKKFSDFVSEEDAYDYMTEFAIEYRKVLGVDFTNIDWMDDDYEFIIEKKMDEVMNIWKNQ